MHPFEAGPANSLYTRRIHPALTSFADEILGTLARLLAYVLTLVALAVGGITLWDRLPDASAMAPLPRETWSIAGRSAPAFAVSQFNFQDKTETYEIFRHPAGGRKDIFHWAGLDKRPVAELEMYRPGGELNKAGPAIADVAARMDPDGMREFEAAGIIGSKFGTVSLLRAVGGADNTHGCLGFIKSVDDPHFRISGWTCQGDNLPVRRAAISCMLNRLTLLSAGNDPKLAELFAHAELRRGDCSPSAAPVLSADWLTGADNPRLRGAF